MVTYSVIVEEMEEVFRALSDPTRRVLLDRLFLRDGQTLTELGTTLGMTRFGVMKHLRVLENARLVTTRRAGREKLHYLNPVPIRLIHDRWISKYAEPWARSLAALKTDLEGGRMAPPRHVYEVYIRATPERIWNALTDPEVMRGYYFGMAAESTWEQGAPVRWINAEGIAAREGTVLACEPPRRLSTTFRMLYTPELAAERPSRLTWQIEPLGEACKLTLTHDDFDGETATYLRVREGWPVVLSALKTLLETGQPLVLG